MAENTTPAIEFKLVVNWKQLLTRAWSIRFAAAAVGLEIADLALPVADIVLPIPDRTFAILSALAGIGAIVARLLDQGLTTEKQDGK